ncbi:MAG TPA: carboxypeptidase-like regulatory domain-containing protein, partial [Segetibacter sp.]
MTLKRLLKLLILPLLLLTLQVVAQERVVTGRVTDVKDGSPITNASVVVKGGTKGTSTGTDGSFRLSVPTGATTLV